MSKVLNVAGHPIDLNDGRTLAPGEEAEGVDTDHPHNRAVIVRGLAIVLEGTTPRKTQPNKLAKAVADDASNDSEEEENR